MAVTGGFQVDPDGRVRGTFTHNPSSLRLSMHSPNLQQIPRGSTEIEKWVKECFVAPAGYTFWERDFSGIEAVLVGYFAGSPGYIRLAKRDVHSFYTAYALNALGDGRVGANDLPLLSWPDDKLFASLAHFKKLLNHERNSLYKHLVHGANYLQTPAGASEHIFKSTGRVFDRKLITNVMGVYFELFPEIRQWHRALTASVDGTKQRGRDRDSRGSDDRVDPWTLGVCHVKNPFGYTHRFYNVLDWEKVNGEWVSSFGEDAKRLVSFLPQSTAAAIIKGSAKRLYYEFPWVGETLRLLIHDSVLGESKEKDLETCLTVSDQVMSAPIPELPLDPTWGVGEYLSIGTEAKSGPSWGTMH
jgi:hypothetical protein